MNVLLPINLDRLQSPICKLLIEIVVNNPEFQFTSFSKPSTDEDREMGEWLWSLPQLKRGSVIDLCIKKFDIVHHASATRFGYCSGMLRQLLPLIPATYIFTANCQPYPTHPNLDLLLKCGSAADLVIPVSEVVKNDFERLLAKECGQVIPNGFDPNYYQIGSAPQIRVKYLEGSLQPYLLYASAFLDRKEPDMFLDLLERMPDIQGVMVGSIPDQELYAAIQKRAESMENVRVLGVLPRRDLRDLMKESVAMIYTSVYEGFPLTLVEAIGCGTPVIARPRSSMPELITHGENGWMYERDESERWISRIRSILRWNDEERRGHAEAARKSVIERYSWESIGRAYGEVYRSAKRGVK